MPGARGSDSGGIMHGVVGRRRTEGYNMGLLGQAGPSSSSSSSRAGGVGAPDGGRGRERRTATGWSEGQDIMQVPTRIFVNEEQALGMHPGEDLTLGFAAGRAAAASLRQALLGARGAGSSTAGPSGAGPSGEAARGAAAAALTDRNRLGVLRKSLEWMPSKFDRDGTRLKSTKGTKGTQAGGKSTGAPVQTLQRQRDKFVPLPYVASELGALDELPEGVESDSTGLYHSLPEQAGEGLLSTLSHEHDLHGLDLHRHRPTIATAHPSSTADAAASQGHALQGLGGGGAGVGAALVTGEAGQAGAYRGRITVYCIADALDRKALLSLLQRQYKSKAIHTYADAVHLCLGVTAPSANTPTAGAPAPAPFPGSSPSAKAPVSRLSAALAPGSPTPPALPHAASCPPASVGAGGGVPPVMGAPGAVVADAFFFDSYGVIICWGLDEHKEKELVKQVSKVCEVESYLPDEVEVDEFEYAYSANERPHIRNDIFSLNRRQVADYQVRLAISYALAQSAKLSVFEGRVMELAEETKDLPESLAERGKVDISSTTVAMLIGKVFLQSSSVNLLGTVLDKPSFFWTAPDSLQALYERANEYLELGARLEVLNTRFEVLQEMLDMLRDHQNNWHASRLEWIIIWLLVIDVVLMLFQMLGIFGIVRNGPIRR